MSAIHSPSFQHVIKLGAKLKMSLNLLVFILFFPPKKFEGFFVFFFFKQRKSWICLFQQGVNNSLLCQEKYTCFCGLRNLISGMTFESGGVVVRWHIKRLLTQIQVIRDYLFRLIVKTWNAGNKLIK